MVQYVEARCAVVQLGDGLVVNIIVAQPSNEPQIGCKLIEIASGEQCDIGWVWNGSTFVNPSPPLPEAEG